MGVHIAGIYEGSWLYSYDEFDRLAEASWNDQGGGSMMWGRAYSTNGLGSRTSDGVTAYIYAGLTDILEALFNTEDGGIVDVESDESGNITGMGESLFMYDRQGDLRRVTANGAVLMDRLTDERHQTYRLERGNGTPQFYSRYRFSVGSSNRFDSDPIATTFSMTLPPEVNVYEYKYPMALCSDSCRFLHTNNQLFITHVSDIAGRVRGRNISPFGEVIRTYGVNLDTPLSGIMEFLTNDLFAQRFRTYKSGLGRYLSVDPVSGAIPETESPYTYANHNPLKYIDMSGAFTLGEAMGVAGILGINAASGYAVARMTVMARACVNCILPRYHEISGLFAVWEDFELAQMSMGRYPWDVVPDVDQGRRNALQHCFAMADMANDCGEWCARLAERYHDGGFERIALGLPKLMRFEFNSGLKDFVGGASILMGNDPSENMDQCNDVAGVECALEEGDAPCPGMSKSKYDVASSLFYRCCYNRLDRHRLCSNPTDLK